MTTSSTPLTASSVPGLRVPRWARSLSWRAMGGLILLLALLFTCVSFLLLSQLDYPEILIEKPSFATAGTSLVPGALPLSSTLHRPLTALADPFRQQPLITPARPLSASAYVIYSLAWSPDGNYLASACADRTVQISAAMSGQHVFTYSNHIVNVLTVAWSPNGKRIVSGDAYSKIFLWEAATGQTILTYGGHSGNIYSVRWSPNGKFIASCAEDTTVQVWKATD